VNKCFIVVLFAGTVWAGDPRTQFDRLKSEGRSAIESQDWVAAEARYLELLEMSAAVHPSTTEMYAEIVSPLAQIYKRTDNIEKLENLFQQRLEKSTEGMDRGLSQADLGFFYQNSDFASSDQFHGERLIEEAMNSFERCTANKNEGEQCRHRLADTAGIQGAIFFQKHEYEHAEPLFRRVLTAPETSVQEEIVLVSLRALSEILVMKHELSEAKQLEARATAFEIAHPDVMARLKHEGTKSRSR
jgi:tetratricopeptide (TPR) repeat protein